MTTSFTQTPADNRKCEGGCDRMFGPGTGVTGDLRGRLCNSCRYEQRKRADAYYGLKVTRPELAEAIAPDHPSPELLASIKKHGDTPQLHQLPPDVQDRIINLRQKKAATKARLQIQQNDGRSNAELVAILPPGVLPRQPKAGVIPYLSPNSPPLADSDSQPDNDIPGWEPPVCECPSGTCQLVSQPNLIQENPMAAIPCRAIAVHPSPDILMTLVAARQLTACQ